MPVNMVKGFLCNNFQQFTRNNRFFYGPYLSRRPRVSRLGSETSLEMESANDYTNKQRPEKHRSSTELL